jgi:hypothetical protein
MVCKFDEQAEAQLADVDNRMLGLNVGGLADGRL